MESATTIQTIDGIAVLGQRACLAGYKEADRKMSWRDAVYETGTKSQCDRWSLVMQAAEGGWREQVPDTQQTTDDVAASLLPFLTAGCSEDGVCVAALMLNDSFEAWDRQERLQRFRVFANEVQEEWQAADSEQTPEERESEVDDGCTVVIGNLGAGVTEEELVELFGQVGTVELAVLDRESWARVVFQHPEDAEEAAERFDGVRLAGLPMEITYSC